jgi:hypothetical protein
MKKLNKAANTVTIIVVRGLNIAEKRGPLFLMHHAWRQNTTADPIIPCKIEYIYYKIIYIQVLLLLYHHENSTTCILHIKCNRVELET